MTEVLLLLTILVYIFIVQPLIIIGAAFLIVELPLLSLSRRTPRQRKEVET